MAEKYMIPGYEFRTELEVVRNIQPKPTLFRTKFFPVANEEYLPTETAQYDEVTEGAPMAKYINPRLPAAPTDRPGFVTKEIRTPWIQEARIIDGDQFRRREAGENIYSVVSAADRARQFRDGDYIWCIDAIDNRIEHQCSAMILQGRVDITNKERTVDYFIDFSLPNIMTLTGGNRWGQTGVNPRDTMIVAFNALLELGYVADEVIMGEKAYRAFEAYDKIREDLDIRRFELGLIAPTKVEGITTEQYKGTLRDPMVDIYTYNAIYRDPDTERVRKFIPDNVVLMHTSEARNNSLFYGAVTIMDEDEEWRTVEGRYVPEAFRVRRPPSELIQVTSRPIPVPRNVDSWFVMYVM